MMVLNILLDLCGAWWLPWLMWLLPFLLGWLFWSLFSGGKLKRRIEELEGQVSSWKSKYSALEKDLDECRKKRADLEGDLAIANGRVREWEKEKSEWETRLRESESRVKAAETKSSFSASSGLAASAAASSSFAAKTPPAPEVPKAPPVVETPKVESSLAAEPTTPAAPTTSKYAKLKEDNLQILEGIGPKMNQVLIENGVSSWSVLASKQPSDIQDILNKYGDKYKIIDPSDWPRQAKFAATGNWDGLIAAQKEDGSDSKAEKVMIKLGILKQWKQDDLKAVEGIGPKISELLKKGGINTWRELSNTAVPRIQEILDAAGPRYKLADPGSWPKQAGLAADAKWDDLEKLQDLLQGGK